VSAVRYQVSSYGEIREITQELHHRTALQSSFPRGNFDIARILLTKGADIEHIDSDGYSVLSYLWVVDKPLEKSGDFMRLCLSNDFFEVNACDSRGWSAFHRAAAIWTPEDVEAFLRLGASLDLSATWYGWTALFLAASHDIVETLQAIIRHSGSDVYESLDGDGWNLLYCCIYFGAPRVMRILLQNGIDINQLTHPAPLPEDPELSYRELTPCDIALYIGPNRYRMFMEALAETGREEDLKETPDMYWDAIIDTRCEESEEEGSPRPIYGAEDVDDRWTLLHWASYNGSLKVKGLFLLKGVDLEHMDAITLEGNPTLLPTSPFKDR
jgi:ankyrin repeat protein